MPALPRAQPASRTALQGLLLGMFTAALLVCSFAVPAQAESRTVHFQGKSVRVPAGWAVIRLAEQPRTCVRLDRRAVYLGTPSANQRCPVDAIGRRRAILVGSGSPAPACLRLCPHMGGQAQARAPAQAGGSATATASAVTGSRDFTGLGFDACTAPSARTMAAWAASPYRAVGVYIGGVNRACSQPNLTSSWVEEQVAEEWHLIPTYVGLQAPTSSCTSCATLSPTLAAPQGAAAARDAVADAQSVGMGPGSPIYYDMESYTQTTTATRATLNFLAAWTDELHALGYISGVYSSSSSGIADLADQVGTGYPLPDDLWIANWNGQQNTRDPYVPATAWADHQRIHQYRGGHNETWGGVTINIDNNYVEGATVGATAAEPLLPPLTVRHVRPRGGTVKLWVRCGWISTESCPGRIVLRTQARLPLGARPGTPTRVARLAVARKLFRLGGGRAHAYRVAIDSRGWNLLRRRGLLRAQLLVAIPGASATRTVALRTVR